MRKCNDEAPHPKTPDLPFLSDSEFRTALRSDLSQAHAGLEGNQWKASIVLGGSVLEALLLWLVRSHWQSRGISVIAAYRKLHAEPERWHLPDYIEVAHEATLIDDETRKQCELSKDFRNLIHPGREIRLQKKSTRGRALGTLAAVELLIESIEKNSLVVPEESQ